jgi:hypothetical protein
MNIQPMTLYDNEYSSNINIHLYETFSVQTLRACALSHLLDTLSDVLDKCLRFSLIKIESVSNKSKPSHAWFSLLIFCIYFPIKKATFSFN